MDQIKALGIDLPASHAEFFLPRLRADLCICASYKYSSGAPLKCPVTAYGSNDDPLVPQKNIDKWAAFTTGKFNSQIMSGGHFFLESDCDNLTDSLKEELATFA